MAAMFAKEAVAMTTLGAMIALLVLVGLVIVGLIVNLYLYMNGAFRRRSFNTAYQVSSAPAIEDDWLDEQGATPRSDSVTGNYARRLLLTIFFILLALGLLIALVVSVFR